MERSRFTPSIKRCIGYGSGALLSVALYGASEVSHDRAEPMSPRPPIDRFAAPHLQNAARGMDESLGPIYDTVGDVLEISSFVVGGATLTIGAIDSVRARRCDLPTAGAGESAGA